MQGKPATNYHQYHNRVTALQALLVKEKFDAFLISHFANRRYLSGYTAGDYPPNETAGFLLITPTAAYLITNFLYAQAAHEETAGAGFEMVIAAPGTGLAATTADLIKKLGVRRVGFEAIALVFDFYEAISEQLAGKADLVATRSLVEELRLVKDAEEVLLLRRAIAISDQAFNETRPLIQPGVSEKQIAWEIERRIREFGGEALAFDTIVASGPNGATPHAVPTDRLFQLGDSVIIDMGARYEGYNSDMTRTVCVGEPTARFKEIYNIVLEAQARSTEAIQPGLTGGAADKIARDIISNYGYGDMFGHSLGHGIGLAVHESPSLRKDSQHVLAPNMIHSVEPGIYLADWGGVRIEDLVLVTSDGHEELTNAIKDDFYK